MITDFGAIRLARVLLKGPLNTPYENGSFSINVMITSFYPVYVPTIKFVTKIYHLNICFNGWVLLEMLNTEMTILCTDCSILPRFECIVYVITWCVNGVVNKICDMLF